MIEILIGGKREGAAGNFSIQRRISIRICWVSDDQGVIFRDRYDCVVLELSIFLQNLYGGPHIDPCRFRMMRKI